MNTSLAPSETDLRDLLSPRLNDYFGRPVKIDHIDLRESMLRSSHLLQEAELQLSDGTIFSLILKCLGREGMASEIQDQKPSFVYDSLREPFIYETIIPRNAFDRPLYVGCLRDFRPGIHWLVLEKVEAVPLSEIGDFDSWVMAARWLAHFHGHFNTRKLTLSDPGSESLLDYSQEYFYRWFGRACLLQKKMENVSALELLRDIESEYSDVVSRVSRMSRTLVHGEYYPSNILVERGSEPIRILPVDWEMSGIGPPLLDLAALVSGSWKEEQRAQMTDAYQQEFCDWDTNDGSTFKQHLACCQLCISVQWLGWSSNWSPPSPHAHDWLHEAQQALRRLW